MSEDGSFQGEYDETDNTYKLDDDNGSHRYQKHDPLGLYSILGLTPDADPAAIRHAFLTLSQIYHTDKHAQQSDEALHLMSERFQQLLDAYNLLSDPRKRIAYSHSGKSGVDRLSLVPVTCVNPSEINKYLNIIAFEANAKKTAELLSCSSRTNVELSVAHWAMLLNGGIPGRTRQRKEITVPPVEQHDTPSLSSDYIRPKPGDQEVPEAVHGTNEAMKEAPTSNTFSESPDSQPNSQTSGTIADVTEVIINGSPQYVAILPPHIQQQLRQQQTKMEPHPTGTQTQGAPSNGNVMRGGMLNTARGQDQFRSSRAFTLPPLVLFMTMSTTHMFNHPISPNSSLNFEADFSQSKRGRSRGGLISRASLKVGYEHVYSAIVRSGVYLKASMKGLQFGLSYNRALSLVTSFSAKLIGYDNGAFLQRFVMTVKRKLSPVVTWENSLTMTPLQEGGSWNTGLSWRQADSPSEEQSENNNNNNKRMYDDDSYDQPLQGTDGSVNEYRQDSNVSGSSTGCLSYLLSASKKHIKKFFRGNKHSGGCYVSIHPGALNLNMSHELRLPIQQIRLCSTYSSHLFGGVTQVGYEVWYEKSKLEKFGIGTSTILPFAFSAFAPLWAREDGGGRCLLWASAQHSMAANTVTLLYGRGSHRVSIPIVVSVGHGVPASMALFVTPILGMTVFRLLYRSFSRLKLAREIRKRRLALQEEVLAAKAKCALEISALIPITSRKRANEQGVGGGGLIILKAVFGVLHPVVPVLPVARAAGESDRPATSIATTGETDDGARDTGDAPYPLTLDVTDSLQILIHDSSLSIANGPKTHLTGFYDVDPATSPRTEQPYHVWVQYLFRKNLHEVEFSEEEEWILPQKCHLVNSNICSRRN